jgi:hypothetical protein
MDLIDIEDEKIDAEILNSNKKKKKKKIFCFKI